MSVIALLYCSQEQMTYNKFLFCNIPWFYINLKDNISYNMFYI
jgi:hypothetical protein